MKTVNITIYNVEELQELYPAAFKKAADDFIDMVYEDDIIVEEILDEVKAATGYLCADISGWSFQPYGRCYIDFELLKTYDTSPKYAEEEIQTLINGIDEAFGEHQERIQRWGYVRVRPESVRECKQTLQDYMKDLQRLAATAKLTGVDEDDEKIGAQVERILDDAFYVMETLLEEITDNAAIHAQEILEYYNSEEYFVDMARDHDWHYTKQGWRLDDENN